LFEIFLAGVDAPMSSRDDLDGYRGTWALFELTGDERTEAENILIAKVAEDDGRAAAALAEAGCVRAIPALVERTTASPSPTMRIAAARALLDLGDHSGRAALVDLLRTGTDWWYDRSAAVELLAEFPDPDTDLMLHLILADPDCSVRSSAISALLTAYRLDGDETSRGEVLLSISGRLLSSLRSVRDEALAELRSVLARWKSGETAEQLGLTWRADQQTEPLRSFVASVTSEAPEGAEDYPLDGLSELTSRERRYVEDFLLLYLDRDRRAVRAVARLGVRRAITPLHELLQAADDAMAAEITAALRQLNEDPQPGQRDPTA
jgi:HEAT repeat protein